MGIGRLFMNDTFNTFRANQPTMRNSLSLFTFILLPPPLAIRHLRRIALGPKNLQKINPSAHQTQILIICALDILFLSYSIRYGIFIFTDSILDVPCHDLV